VYRFFLAQFYGQAVLFCDSVYSWQWDFGDGSSFDTTANPLHQYDSAGLYSVTYIISTVSLSDTITKQLNIYSIRIPDFINNTICLGTATIFTDTTPCSPISWQWDFGDGSPGDTNQHPTHLYASSGNYNVMLTAAWSDGYTDSITKTVTVLADTGNANFGWNFTPICGTDVKFSDSSLGEPTGWQWDFGDGSPGDTTQNPFHIYYANDIFTVTLIVSYDNGCPPDTLSKLIDIQYNWTPSYPKAACVGDTLTFSSTFNGDTTLVDVTWWQFGDGTNPFLTYFFYYQRNVTHVYNTPGVYSIDMRISYDDFGCFEWIVDTIVIYAPKSINLGNDTSICKGEMLILDAGDSGSSYLWSTGDTTQSIQIDSAGIYYVEVDTICPGMDAITVTTKPALNASAGEDTTICLGNSVTLNASGGMLQATYIWNPPTGLNNPFIKNPIAKPDTTTKYIVTVNDTNGCNDTVSVLITMEECVFFVFVPNSFSPNEDGVNDILYVRGNGINILRFKIYNRWGEKVFSAEGGPASGGETLIMEGWDGTFKGKKLNIGTYVYYIEGEFIDKSPISRKGNVALIR